MQPALIALRNAPGAPLRGVAMLGALQQCTGTGTATSVRCRQPAVRSQRDLLGYFAGYSRLFRTRIRSGTRLFRITQTSLRQTQDCAFVAEYAA